MKNYLLWNSNESSILISSKSTKTISTHKGKIEINNPIEYGQILLSSTGKKYYVLPPTHKDINQKLSRKTNTFVTKDLSIIIGYTSINKESIVLEIGTGSGALSVFLSNFVKKIISIDINFYNLVNAKKNIDKYAYENNINLILSNENNQIFKKNFFDAIIIDLPQPEIYADICYDVLKNGGDLVFGVPNIEQVKKAREIFSQKNFVKFTTIEIWIREWVVRPYYSRPHHELQAHSMFFTFCKKINKKD